MNQREQGERVASGRKWAPAASDWRLPVETIEKNKRRTTTLINEYFITTVKNGAKNRPRGLPKAYSTGSSQIVPEQNQSNSIEFNETSLFYRWKWCGASR